MRGIRFSIEQSFVGGVSDRAYLDEGQDPTADVLVAAVVDDLDVAVEVTVGGVTMHLAAWRDPEHWADDWREKLDGVDHEDVPEAVAGLLSGAVENDA